MTGLLLPCLLALLTVALLRGWHRPLWRALRWGWGDRARRESDRQGPRGSE